MSQASATKLIPKLRYNIRNRRNLRNPQGPVGRHSKIKKTVTALFKFERIELNYHKADESRGYAERLISDAIRYGDTHKPTMEMASYWIIDKPIIHKLFKVLAPRYKDSTTSYTKIWRAPFVYPGHKIPKCVLELRNNIYPPLVPDNSFKKNLIHNILLEEARKEYREKKAAKELEKSIEEQTVAGTQNEKIQENAENKTSMEFSEKNRTDTNNENVKVDSESETKDKSEVTVEEDLDISKLKIDENQGESPVEVDKK